jgi:ABC-2 type transport system permease protein
MLTLRQAVLLAWKDTRVFVADRFAVLFAFAFPLVFIVALTLAFGDTGPSTDDVVLTIATAEPNQPNLSRQLIADMQRSGRADMQALDLAVARSRLDSGELQAYLAFPEDFSLRLSGGQPTSVAVVSRAAATASAAALRGIANSIANTIAAVSAAQAAATTLVGAAAVQAAPPAAIFAAATSIQFPAEEVGGITPQSASNFALPGYLTMFVFFAAALSAESITRERKNQTIERLMSNGVGRGAVVLGKYLSGIYRGLAQLLVLWVVGLGLLGVRVGASPVGVILVSVLFVCLSTGYGVMIAALARTVNSAATAAILSSLILAPIGGSWWPIFITPPFMQALARLSPHGWANGAFNKLMIFGADFEDITLELIALVMFSIVFVSVGVWRFRLSVD